MKALSVKQPFAWLIVHGFKPVENRPWTTAFRGHLLIHASRIFANLDPQEFYQYGFDQDFIQRLFSPLMPIGAILGEVDLIDVVRESDSQWFKGPYGFELANPVAYDIPIPCKGMLGIFDIDQSILKGTQAMDCYEE